MSDDEEDTECPLCVQELDLSDRNFLPWYVQREDVRAMVALLFSNPEHYPSFAFRFIRLVLIVSPLLAMRIASPCGYRVCMWCWHHIRENLNGLCPACRTPYNADPHAFSAVDRQE
jgi:hypothetical protein